MSRRTSRIPGFYKMSVAERRRLAAELLDVDSAELTRALSQGGLDQETADKTVENVIGTYALPFALTLNVRMNGRDYLAPMVVEEPSVVAAASGAAKLIRQGGGFAAEADPPIMISQVQLEGVVDAARAAEAVKQHEEEIWQLADRAVPGLVTRGGGVRGIEVRELPEDVLVIHLLVDCRDAMGANLVNTVAEATAPRLAAITGGRIGLRILSNLADRRCVRVSCTVPEAELALANFSGADVCEGIVRASRFADLDPYRAATHNKGVMNGIDAVAMATGNDWRAVEAGAHAYAARDGQYKPICRWKKNGRGDLQGQIELPLALGTVGGPSRVHPGARFGIHAAGVASAQELGMLAACVGMASNLAALRALSSVGIQQGHMALHARSVAIAAGAKGSQVELIAARIHGLGDITLDTAKRELLRLVGRAAAACAT